ncbi:MAG: hypothetical protein D6705_05415 [Deltaproteobacteria bacterium]|nr:MAG: hypothetical protein D6705_05415 [Deltaproteobacteria bacterium]
MRNVGGEHLGGTSRFGGERIGRLGGRAGTAPATHVTVPMPSATMQHMAPSDTESRSTVIVSPPSRAEAQASVTEATIWRMDYAIDTTSVARVGRTVRGP